MVTKIRSSHGTTIQILIILGQKQYTYMYITMKIIFKGFLVCLIKLIHFPGFMKLHMGLVVLVQKMSVLINFLLQNTNLVSVIKFCW